MMMGSVSVTQTINVRDVEANLIGDASILQQPLLGLFCSQRCPGELILKAYDAAKALRESGQVVVSGFHSPVEKDILAILLRGRQPLAVCAARYLENYRIPREYVPLIQEGRLSIIAPLYPSSQKRITQETVKKRNDLILRICDRLLIIYAEPGGSVDHLCRQAIDGHIEVYAPPSRKNDHLFAAGAIPWESSLAPRQTRA